MRKGFSFSRSDGDKDSGSKVCWDGGKMAQDMDCTPLDTLGEGSADTAPYCDGNMMLGANS